MLISVFCAGYKRLTRSLNNQIIDKPMLKTNSDSDDFILPPRFKRCFKTRKCTWNSPKTSRTVRNMPMYNINSHSFVGQSGNVGIEVPEPANWKLSEPLFFYSQWHGLSKWHQTRLPIVISESNFTYPALLALTNIISYPELRLLILNILFFTVLLWKVRIMQKSQSLARTMNRLSALTVVMLIPKRN